MNTVREDYWTAECAIIASNVKHHNLLNETVSLGEYSWEGALLGSQNSKCQDLAKFQFWVGGILG